MATFNVFVEGPVDSMGLRELADSMSQRYGLPAADLVARLRRGRFRVKSNLDAPTAERYRKDLERIGARVVVEDSLVSPTATPVVGVPITPALPPSQPVTTAAPLQSRAPALSLPPLIAQQASEANPTKDPRTFTILGPQHTREPGRPGTVPPPASATTPPSGLPARPGGNSLPPQLASGLAAAFAPASAQQQDLGALAASSFSLASLDGQEDTPRPPPPEPPLAVVNIAVRPKTDAPRTKPLSKPMDLFAPPDAGDQEMKVELAVEEVAERAAKRASIPPEPAPAAPLPSLLPSHRMGTQPVGGTSAAPETKPVSRQQFVLAVAIALVVGFLPAHLLANTREETAFAAIDRQVIAVQESADTPEAYQVLDAARTKLAAQKEDRRSNIALQSMLIWALVSAGVGFGLLQLLQRR